MPRVISHLEAVERLVRELEEDETLVAPREPSERALLVHDIARRHQQPAAIAELALSTMHLVKLARDDPRLMECLGNPDADRLKRLVMPLARAPSSGLAAELRNGLAIQRFVADAVEGPRELGDGLSFVHAVVQLAARYRALVPPRKWNRFVRRLEKAALDVLDGVPVIEEEEEHLRLGRLDAVFEELRTAFPRLRSARARYRALGYLSVALGIEDMPKKSGESARDDDERLIGRMRKRLERHEELRSAGQKKLRRGRGGRGG